MSYLTPIFVSLPDALKAMQDNPMGCLVLVTLGAFGLLAYTIHKLK